METRITEIADRIYHLSTYIEPADLRFNQVLIDAEEPLLFHAGMKSLFPLVSVNTPVWLVNEPVKVARVGGQVWLEVHPPVDAEGQRAEVDLEGFYSLANTALGETPAAIHWDFVLATLKEANGLPAMVGLELAPDALPPAPPPLPETPAAPAAPTPAVPAAMPATPAVPAS